MPQVWVGRATAARWAPIASTCAAREPTALHRTCWTWVADVGATPPAALWPPHPSLRLRLPPDVGSLRLPALTLMVVLLLTCTTVEPPFSVSCGNSGRTRTATFMLSASESCKTGTSMRSDNSSQGNGGGSTSVSADSDGERPVQKRPGPRLASRSGASPRIPIRTATQMTSERPCASPHPAPA